MNYRPLALLSLYFTACAAPAAGPSAPNASIDVGQADGGAAEVTTADPADAAVPNDDASPDGVAVDAVAADATLKPWPKGLYGKKPDAPVSLPAFTQVVDTTGASVSPDDLKGHWSVLWFYPMASTGG